MPPDALIRGEAEPACAVRKKVRRKLLEPAPNLSSFAILVRMTPLSLLLVRRIWLLSANRTPLNACRMSANEGILMVKTSTMAVVFSKVRFFRLDSPERAAFAP